MRRQDNNQISIGQHFSTHIASYISTNFHKNTEIIDIGVGYGTLAEILTNVGFTNIDGIDYRDRYEKSLYRETYHGKFPLVCPDKKYDVVVASLIVLSTVDIDIIDKIIYVLKPNGHIFITLQDGENTEYLRSRIANVDIIGRGQMSMTRKFGVDNPIFKIFHAAT